MGWTSQTGQNSFWNVWDTKNMNVDQFHFSQSPHVGPLQTSVHSSVEAPSGLNVDCSWNPLSEEEPLTAPFCCCVCQRRQSLVRESQTWMQRSSWSWERDSASLRRSFSRMWMSTCPLHTCRLTTRGVSLVPCKLTHTHRVQMSGVKSLWLIAYHSALSLVLAPLGSVSSMEVNVDMLEQMEHLDISDQEALDVFLSFSGEEGGLASPLPGNS